MNIRLGLYEIFSRIVPGSIYIFAVGQLLVILGFIDIDWKTLNDLSIASAIGLVIVAYVLSEVLDRLALIWFRVFGKRGISTRALATFRSKHQHHWDLKFEDKDLPILIAHIRTRDLILAAEIERHNAISIMLRNISLGLLIIAVNAVIIYASSQNLTHLLTGFVFLVFSVIIIRESIKFRRWYYSNIFETVVGYRIELEKIILPVGESPLHSQVQRREKRKKINE